MLSDVPAGWPATPWKLTAAESSVLLRGSTVPGPESFKLALMELVTRGCLRLAEVTEPRLLLGRRRAIVLADGSRPRAPAEPVLAGLWELYLGLPAASFDDGLRGVKLAIFLKAAARRQSGPRRFTEAVVLPALVERGLMEHQQRRVLGLFRQSRYELVPSGQQAQAELQRWMALARDDFSSWTRDDPARAAAFTSMALAVLLLTPSVFPDLQLLSQQLQLAQQSAVGVASGSETGYAGDDELASLDLPSLDLGGLSFDFGVFDSFESAFDAIDSAVDAGGGDGGDGGDGGGGDGGGD